MAEFAAAPLPVNAFQIRAVLSNELVAMRSSVGDQAADHTIPLCPRSTASSSPVPFQTRVVPSTEAVRMRCPLGENAARAVNWCPRSQETPMRMLAR